MVALAVQSETEMRALPSVSVDFYELKFPNENTASKFFRDSHNSVTQEYTLRTMVKKFERHDNFIRFEVEKLRSPVVNGFVKNVILKRLNNFEMNINDGKENGQER